MYSRKDKFKVTIILFIAISIVSLTIAKNSLLNNINDIEKQTYKIQAEKNIQLLNTLIKNKEQSTLNLALAISEFPSIQEAIKQDKYDNLLEKLDNFISSLNQHSEYKDVNFHIINKDGRSKFRSWTNKTNDSLIGVRYDVEKFIKEPKVTTSISVGRLWIAFRSMVPIFNKGEFVGIIEVITYFDSIIKYLEQIGITPVIIVDKRYYDQFFEKEKRVFIDQYNIANRVPIPYYTNFIKRKGLNKFLNSVNHYVIEDSYFITLHQEFEYNNNIIATFLLFEKIEDVKSTSINSLRNLSLLTIFAVVVVMFFIIILIYYHFKHNRGEYYNKILQRYSSKLKRKVEAEVEENRKKDVILANQTKHAAIGEMLGNIAHQWKQPLSAISTATSGLQIKYNYNILTADEFEDLSNSILNNTKYLSDTIDDFRDFFKKDKLKIEFNIAHLITNCYSILKSLYVNNNITIKLELDETLIYNGYKNELSQVLLNLLSNAKDALLQKDIEQKIVYVKLYDTTDFIIFEFHDNAGGVPNDINEKIFEPYFTTKHQAQGTGIGLYMSSEIITKHFDGQIYNENSSFIFESTEHFGANFIIKLPKS